MFSCVLAGATLHLLTVAIVTGVEGTSTTVSPSTGHNVCYATQRVVSKRIVPRTREVFVRSLQVDSAFPFIHYTVDIVNRTVNITEYTVREHKVQVCCKGYTRSGNKCLPLCSPPCAQGKCIAPSRCTCRPGWTGYRCERTCDHGWYGPNCAKKCNCAGGSSCDPQSGRCRCAPGFIGERCQRTCPQGLYGALCLFKCRCQNGGHCDPKTGNCTCSPGYRGLTCAKRCRRERFGINCAEKCQCKHRASCDHRTGKCLCRGGFYGKDCSRRCPPGFYGIDCKYKCQCENGGVCDPRNGYCHCQPGWHGERCSNACSDGKYGAGCAYTCNCTVTDICDRVKGCTPVNVINFKFSPNDTGASNNWAKAKKHLITGFAVAISAVLFFIFFAVGILIGSMRRFRRSFESRRLDESVSTISTDEKMEKFHQIDYPVKNHLHAEKQGQENPGYQK